MIVVDASALLEVLLQTPVAGSIAKRIFNSGQALHAPHLVDIEIAQVLRRYTATRYLAQIQGRELLNDLLAWEILRHPHGLFLPRVWSLRHNLTAYDAVYVALAEALDAPLITHDRRLANSSGHRARVELV